MNILITGGSGMVGTFITPYLTKKHNVTVFDIAPPKHDNVKFIQGSMLEPNDIEKALDGIDAFVNVTMKSPQGGETIQSITQIKDNYQLNTFGLHLFLYKAQEAGVMKGVHTSTMSVHYRKRTFYHAEEHTQLDTPSVYGLTKGFGELICQYFATWFDMNIIALRITGPRPRDRWLKERENSDHKYAALQGDGSPIWLTDEEDLANAYLGGLEAVKIGHGRFDSVLIAADPDHEEHNLSKAKKILNWHPKIQIDMGLLKTISYFKKILI